MLLGSDADRLSENKVDKRGKLGMLQRDSEAMSLAN